jgi:hypothetical protein
VLAWSVACVFCRAKPGEPCAETNPNWSQRHVYRGYNFRRRSLTRPCFHGARWKATRALSAVEQLAVLADPKWEKIDRKFKGFRYDPENEKHRSYREMVNQAEAIRRERKKLFARG